MEKLSRREVVQRVLGGAAAGRVLALVGSWHPIYRHLIGDGSDLERAEGVRGAADWTPRFLKAEQDQELVAVAEAMVPGSTGAGVNRFIDLLLSVDTKEHQREFVTSIEALEDAAKKRFGRGFAALKSNEQEALLTEFSSQEGRREDFHNLKEWITGAYYSSEQGMRELGWNGNYAFESFPGCGHGEQHP
jgi:hypothetical protein